MIGNEKQIDYNSYCIFLLLKEGLRKGIHYCVFLIHKGVCCWAFIVLDNIKDWHRPKILIGEKLSQGLEVRPKGTNTGHSPQQRNLRWLTKSRPINNVRPRMPQPIHPALSHQTNPNASTVKAIKIKQANKIPSGLHQANWHCNRTAKFPLGVISAGALGVVH